MPVFDPLTLSVFGFLCPNPGCGKNFHKSLIDLVMEDTVSSDFCDSKVNVAEHYGKPELEEFLVKNGYRNCHLGKFK